MKPEPLKGKIKVYEVKRFISKPKMDVAFRYNDVCSACEYFLKEFDKLQREWQVKAIREYSFDVPRDILIDDFQEEVKKLFKRSFLDVYEEEVKNEG